MITALEVVRAALVVAVSLYISWSIWPRSLVLGTVDGTAVRDSISMNIFDTIFCYICHLIVCAVIVALGTQGVYTDTCAQGFGFLSKACSG